MEKIYFLIDELVNYGIKKELINESDRHYVTNRLINILKLDEYNNSDFSNSDKSIQEILNGILDWAYDNRIISDNTITVRDIFDTQIMNELISKPSEITKNFYTKLKKNPKDATEYYYKLSENSNYIRRDRINKNQEWKAKTEFGDLDITINLSKPEKDPIEIAALKNAKSVDYPKCLLCRENEGYFGRLNYPARSNHRIIPLELNKEKWFLQYSPYVYYNEHCIVLKEDHVPMKINKNTLIRLLDFVKVLPHYFIGSNADLPIVGGSILNHDHFQGGNYKFAMSEASIEKSFFIDGYENVSVHLLKWPLSVLRLESENKENIISLAMHIFDKWSTYNDESANIRAFTDDTPHNTITPIVRMRNSKFELDIVLRNNRTNNEHPLGIFHPHEDVHHIKKENIGLIEVMGLAVLPARLKFELEKIKEYLIGKVDIETIRNDYDIKKHARWYEYLYDKYGDIDSTKLDDVIKHEIGVKFLQVLKDAGVFKTTKKGRHEFNKFIEILSEIKLKGF